MKRIVILFLLLGNIAYCQNGSKESNTQKHPSNLDPTRKDRKTISVYLPHRGDFMYITKFGGSYCITNDGDSLKSVIINSNEPILTYSMFGNKLLSISSFEIFPGEEIKVSFDEKGNRKLSTPNNPLRTNELSFYEQNLLFSKNYDIDYLIPKGRSFSNIIAYIDSVETARINYLKDYISAHAVTPRFHSMVLQQIREKKNLSLATLLLKTTEKDLKLLEPIIEKTKTFYCQNDTVISLEHKSGLFTFCQFLTIKELKLKKSPENLFYTAIKYFKGKSLDAALYVYLKQALEGNNPSNRKLITEFYSRCKDSDYIENIKSEEAKYNVANFTEIRDALMKIDQSATSWDLLLRKYKGDVIYIDIWASWCMPCINELPYLEKLKKQYADKGVVFISLSTDQKFSEWKDKSEQLNIDNQFSYIIANYANFSLRKTLDIKTIPRFILIDKTGKIVSKDALRPSNKDVNALIDKYL